MCTVLGDQISVDVCLHPHPDEGEEFYKRAADEFVETMTCHRKIESQIHAQSQSFQASVSRAGPRHCRRPEHRKLAFFSEKEKKSSYL